MPVHTYTNWNSRPSDQVEQIEPFRKYFFICEGANTETFYFRRLIDLRKQLGIHPLIDIRLWEKTDEDRNLSFAKNLVAFAEKQKYNPENEFDYERDKMVIVFDGDIFEEKVQGSGGGISIMNGYRMDRTLLTSRDMQMILAGLRSLDSVSGSRYYGQLMEKIQAGCIQFDPVDVCGKNAELTLPIEGEIYWHSSMHWSGNWHKKSLIK